MRASVTAAMVGAILSAGVAVGGPAVAAICAEPVRPFCIDERQQTDGELSRQRCAQMLDSYVEELGNYIGCMKKSVTASEEEHTAMRERLACMREPDKACR